MHPFAGDTAIPATFGRSHGARCVIVFGTDGASSVVHQSPGVQHHENSGPLAHPFHRESELFGQQRVVHAGLVMRSLFEAALRTALIKAGAARLLRDLPVLDEAGFGEQACAFGALSPDVVVFDRSAGDATAFVRAVRTHGRRGDAAFVASGPVGQLPASFPGATLAKPYAVRTLVEAIAPVARQAESLAVA